MRLNYILNWNWYVDCKINDFEIVNVPEKVLFIKMYFKNKGSLHLLAETPESLRDVYNVTIHKIGNKKYGVKVTKNCTNAM